VAESPPSAPERPRRLSSSEFRNVIAHFASGVTVITVIEDGTPRGATANAVSSLTLEPPMVLICMNKSSQTGVAVAAQGAFAINILAANQAALAARFAGKDPDKFDGVPVVTGPFGQPLLSEALAHLECRTVEEVTGGTHSVFIAEVESASAHAGAPLAYFRGRFGRLDLAPDEAAYAAVRERIAARRHLPGETVDLLALSHELDLPAGGLSQALERLEREDLVRQRPAGGYVVTPVDRPTVEHAIDARCTIELGVAARTVGRVSPAEVAALRSAVEETLPLVRDERLGRRDAWVDAQERFHETFLGLTGNEALVQAHQRLNTGELVTLAHGGELGDAAREALTDDHRQLVEAFEVGDSGRACEVIERHADRAKAMLRRVMPDGGIEAAER
jgi:4-nitrophenol 2-monooxygenase / 4-nitrocatechol 4-monooxygenase, reductase component